MPFNYNVRVIAIILLYTKLKAVAVTLLQFFRDVEQENRSYEELMSRHFCFEYSLLHSSNDMHLCISRICMYTSPGHGEEQMQTGVPLACPFERATWLQG